MVILKLLTQKDDEEMSVISEDGEEEDDLEEDDDIQTIIDEDDFEEVGEFDSESFLQDYSVIPHAPVAADPIPKMTFQIKSVQEREHNDMEKESIERRSNHGDIVKLIILTLEHKTAYQSDI